MDQTISLLLVDDERAHVRLMERAFARDGVRWRVRVASSLEEARRALLDDPPDLAFVDILLPDGRGVELLEGADEPDYPVVLMTARGDERVAVEAIKRGALDYVVKSEASVRELPRVAERALRQWRDIAGRREALRALQESEERFRNLIEGSIQGVLVHRHWVPLFANQAFAEILGFESADEVLALESIAPFYAPQDRARFASYLESPLGGQDAPSFFELEATRRDGKAVTLQNVIRPITWSGQLALQHSVIDVSEHKRAEAQATRLGRILDDSLNEIYIADADTLALIQVNRGARKNLGYSSKELRARSLPELLPELGRDRLEALFAPLRTGETERVRLRSDLQRKDGSCYPVEANVQLSRADSRLPPRRRRR